MRRTTERRLEAEYRRAYRDGWKAGIEAVQDLIMWQQLYPSRAYLAALAHWERELAAWETEHLDEPITPPRLRFSMGKRGA